MANKAFLTTGLVRFVRLYNHAFRLKATQVRSWYQIVSRHKTAYGKYSILHHYAYKKQATTRPAKHHNSQAYLR